MWIAATRLLLLPNAAAAARGRSLRLTAGEDELGNGVAERQSEEEGREMVRESV